ncbi:MAG: cyclic nucleotide-binding/CBS domain-containing protein [Haloarculaceae archaeon]
MNRDVSVREVMNEEFVGASESDGLLETVDLWLQEGAAAVVVLRGNEAVGVLTERDVLGLLVAGPDPERATVGDAMTASVPTIGPDRTLSAARDRMASQALDWLVVTAGDGPLGVVTEHDILTAAALGTETASEGTRERAVAAGAAMTEDAGEASATEGFEDQGICEVCGSLSRDLSAFNGQLLCADCRDV